MKSRLVEVEIQASTETLSDEFVRHIIAGASRERTTPAKFLMRPENRYQMGVAISPATVSALVVKDAKRDGSIPEAPIQLRYLAGRTSAYLGSEDQSGQRKLRENVVTGWEITSRSNQRASTQSANWEVGVGRIQISVPKMVEDRPAPVSLKGTREISQSEVAMATGLTENQFEIQPVLGRSRAVCQGVLEAIPVVLPRFATELTDDPLSPSNGNFVRDPMLLRLDERKLTGRLGGLGDLGVELVRQTNSYSGQAVHFAVQAMAEANMASYLASHLSGERGQVHEFMKERMRLMYSAARLAMTAYEFLVDQAIGFAQMGVRVLTPNEFVFAAEATASFFDGMSEAGQFASRDITRLSGVVNQLENDLLALRGGRK